MENIIRLLSKHFKIRIDIGKLYIKLSIFDKENIKISAIFYNFNKKRFSYSYIDYRDVFIISKNSSKKDLNKFIKNLISHPVFKYKKINKF